jgi:hypothetical protein
MRMGQRRDPAWVSRSAGYEKLPTRHLRSDEFLGPILAKTPCGQLFARNMALPTTFSVEPLFVNAL